jgi:tetratricopeptide (TPR) repeat protein
MGNQLSDLEKQRLLAILHLHKVHVPGLDHLVLKLVESISGAKERDSALLTLTYYLAAYGNIVAADEVARQRLQGYYSAAALAGIGSELASTDPSGAALYLSDAEKLLKDVIDVDEQAILLQRISEVYSNLKDWGKAQELANRITVPSDKVYTLTKLAKRLWDEGETEKADKVLLDARASVAETESSDRADALDDIARLLVHMGKESAALNTWEEALQFVNGSLDPPKLVLIICKGLASIGRRERASEVALLIQNEARRAQALALINEQ